MVNLQVNGRWWQFINPVQVVIARHTDDVLAALQVVETAVSTRHLFAAGFMSYEAGGAFDLPVHVPQSELPLLWFGLYEAPIVTTRLPLINGAAGQHDQLNWQTGLTEAAYHGAIQRIKEAIATGYTYQVNYTFPWHASFSGDPRLLFQKVTHNQAAEYMAYVDTGRYAICSASPELFFQLDGTHLLSKPMKGTAVRGRTWLEDQSQMEWLAQSEKNQAENVMIVDMIRNDVGRVAATGTVQVPHLFEIERYPTLLQMTSTVTAETDASLSQLMAALFPCASITGAPKRSTMRLIRELEPQGRDIYTGTIGFWGPGRQAQFNVAIRTVLVDKGHSLATYGVGSGITWDSDAAAEYEECHLKTQVLHQKRPSFDLVESLLWEPDSGYFLFDYHLERLADSAAYFDRPFSMEAVRNELLIANKRFTGPVKVRLLLAQDGQIAWQAVPLAQGALPEPVAVGLAVQPVKSQTIWLFHKTTHRDIYDKARASRPDCAEVLLWNERGELTEASRSNIVVQLSGQCWTPPLESGLLAGTMRRHLLANGIIREKIITVADLAQSEAIYLINSVRCWQQAELTN